MKTEFGDAPEMPTIDLIKLKLMAPQFWVVLVIFIIIEIVIFSADLLYLWHYMARRAAICAACTPNVPC